MKSISHKLIKKEDIIADIIKINPKIEQIFLEYGLRCVGCFASQAETIEIGAMAHGKTEKEIKEIIDKINLFLKTKTKKK
jgi:hybrid cluster-associated redox disulfide protein